MLIRMVIPLSRIDTEECVTVVWIASEQALKEHLEGLGFIPDAAVECVLKGGPHSMSAYWVNHSLVCLRKNMAEEVFVRR